MNINTTSTRAGAAILKVLLVLAFVALALVAGFFYLADEKSRNELDQARAQAEESAQQLQQLQQAKTETQPKPSEESNLELAKLRGDVVKYRAMEKQFQTLQTENQQLRAQLQQLQQANSETAALRNQNLQLQQVAQDSAYTAQCIANLRQIAAAKQQWALENRKTQADVPMDIDIFGKYLPEKPVCPKGGVYILGCASTPRPTCSIHGHTY
jgi:hypothetical protein